MACSVAENKPLTKLREELNIPKVCHSLRNDCIHNYDRLTGNLTLGIPGAIIGYCQALFNPSETPFLHSQKIKNVLKEIEAPWFNSHELFWGYRNKEKVEDYIEQSIAPLRGEGRIPILITALDPATDLKEINDIISTTPAVYENETILFRIVVSNEQSIKNISDLIKKVLSKSRSEGKMPLWWPLLQGNLNEKLWEELKNAMGADWKYLNLAVNPFTTDTIPEFCWKQVTVGQVVLGHSTGIGEDGNIKLPKDMKIQGAKDEDVYNIYQYFKVLNKLEDSPTLIILGPSLPGWNDEENKNRIEKLLPHLRKACGILWNGINPKRQKEIWKLSA